MKIIFLTVILMLAIDSMLFSQDQTQQYQSGDVRFNFKLPHFNTLSFNVNKTFRDIEYGFNGYGAGLECSYRDKKFVELSLCVCIDL